MKVLGNKYSRVLVLVLLMQAGAYYAVALRGERTPVSASLSSFPSTVGEWHMTLDAPIEKEVQDVLKADDTLNRRYANSSVNREAYLFIAFFKTQRYGQSPHSPKNCLPGAGYAPIEDSKLSLKVPEWPVPIVVNKYVTERGAEKSVTLYWYQSHNRVIAGEYSARFWLVVDAIRYRRSDTSIVKIVVPVRDDKIEDATQTGVSFIQALFPSVLSQLPK
ncbi:MAG: EpsI family protein [Acidobacteriia bacterium]|nr:EpsI family protein [Terriglobia bacterium]